MIVIQSGQPYPESILFCFMLIRSIHYMMEIAVALQSCDEINFPSIWDIPLEDGWHILVPVSLCYHQNVGV
jgi:hypothetical protein